MVIQDKILITGCAGYVGSVVTSYLLSKNYNIIGIDSLFFGGESLLNYCGFPNFTFYKADIRDHINIEGIIKNEKPKYIIHLAAIVGDGSCNINKEITYNINYKSTKKLIDLSIKYNVDKFIFPSTCSNYGKMDDINQTVNEESKLNPISLYAELKIEIEKYLINLNLAAFTPIILRFATAYGISSRMRFDLLINEFVKDAMFNKTIQIYGKEFWRPYCHLMDFARVFEQVIKSNNLKYNVFNVGDNSENYTKEMIWNKIIKLFPNAKIEFIEKKIDPRNYRVNFDRVNKYLNFKTSKTIDDGIEEIFKSIKDELFIDINSPRYSNMYIGEIFNESR